MHSLSIILILFVTTHSLTGEIFIKDTGYYEAIPSHSFKINGQNGFLVLNPEERYLARFDSEGSRLEDVGRPGNGPGEFIMALFAFAVNDLIYIHDFMVGRVHVYDSVGIYQKTIQQKAFGIGIRKVADGWLYVRFGGIETEKSHLILAGNDFENPKTLLTWEPFDPIKGMAFKPVRDVYHAVYRDSNAEQVYFYKPGAFEVFLVDVREATIKTFVKLDLPLIEIEASHKQAVSQEPMRRTAANLPLVFPKYFPAIEKLDVDPDGNLCLLLGGPEDNDFPVLVFDGNGKRLPFHYDRQTLTAYLGHDGKHAYFSRETDDMTVIERIKVEAFSGLRITR